MRALESERPVTSLDRPVGHDEDASDLGDFVAVATDAPADEVVDREFLAMLFELARTPAGRPRAGTSCAAATAWTTATP